MSIRSISTFVHDPNHMGAAMDMAVNLARRFNAHLSVVAPGIDRTDPGFYYAGAQAIALRENLDAAEAMSHELKTAVEARLEGELIAWDLDDRILQGPALAEYLSEKVRYSDIVVLPQPYGPQSSHDDVVALEAVLFSAKVPVIVVPDGTRTDGRTDRIQIAWNESDESMNAVRAALPFVSEAGLTDVTVIDPPRHAAGRSDPGGLLACYLNRHGANAEIAILSRSEPRIADILNRRARERGAELLVMGAYGHTRLREAIIGGATRDMLENAAVPVLMAH